MWSVSINILETDCGEKEAFFPFAIWLFRMKEYIFYVFSV